MIQAVDLGDILRRSKAGGAGGADGSGGAVRRTSRVRGMGGLNTLSDGSLPSSSDESDETYDPAEEEFPNSQESLESLESIGSLDSEGGLQEETSKATKIHKFFHSQIPNKSLATLLSSALIILITVCGMATSFLMWITGISTVVEGIKEIFNSTTKGFWQNLSALSLVFLRFLFYLTFVVGLISMLFSASVWLLFHYGFVVRSGGYLQTI